MDYDSILQHSSKIKESEGQRVQDDYNRFIAEVLQTQRIRSEYDNREDNYNYF